MIQTICRYRRYFVAAVLLAAMHSASAAAATAKYVVVINIDGLHAGAIPALGPAGAPNLWRMRTEGAFTDNARTDYARTVTTPSHTTILTARPVISPRGHLWGNNDPDPLSLAPSLHHPHTFSPAKTRYEYVSSVFDVVHDYGQRTGFYVQKDRMELIISSYNAINGAVDVIGADNGRQKIDLVKNIKTVRLLDQWLADMARTPFNYTYLLFARADTTGHLRGFSLAPGSEYMRIVKILDGWVGRIFDLIESDTRFAGKTFVIMTTDHGGNLGGDEHNTASDIDNYRVPFYVWGPGVKPGGDLYALNPQYADPGSSRPTHDAPKQPIRNGSANNLALWALGLPAIPGSHWNTDQSMKVGGSVTSPPSACGAPTINAAADAALFVWRNCDTDGAWHVRATAGGASARYSGKVTSTQAYQYVLPVSLESTDILATTPFAINFEFRIWGANQDGATFAAPGTANLCLQLSAPAGMRVLVGEDRIPVPSPFNLRTLTSCTP